MNQASTNSASHWRSELVYVAMACVEVIYLAPWFMLVLPGADTLSGFRLLLIIAANLLGALLIVRALTRRQATDAQMQLATVIGIVVSVLLTLRLLLPVDSVGAQMPMFVVGKLFIPSPLFTIAGIAFLWNRGLRLATIPATPGRASFGLRLGIVFMLLAALIPSEAIHQFVLLLLPAFFFFGLLSTALTRSASLRSNHEGQQSAFGNGWLSFTLIISGVLCIAGYGMALLIGGFHVDSIVSGLWEGWIWVFAAIASVFAPLFDLIAQFLNSLLRNTKPLVLESTASQSLLDQLNLRVMQIGKTPSPIFNFLPALCLSGAVVLVIVLVLRRLRNRRYLMVGDGEERETIENPDVLAGLRGAVRRGLDELGERLELLNRFGARDANMALTIKRLYVRMAALAAAEGYERKPPQTPYEYEPAIGLAFPGFKADIAALTRAYVNVHYGELPDDPALVIKASQAVDQMAAFAAK